MFTGFISVSAPGLHKISNITTAFHMLTKEIAEGTQTLEPEEDALNLLKQTPFTDAK